MLAERDEECLPHGQLTDVMNPVQPDHLGNELFRLVVGEPEFPDQDPEEVVARLDGIADSTVSRGGRRRGRGWC
jgi:hypothetical protein